MRTVILLLVSCAFTFTLEAKDIEVILIKSTIYTIPASKNLSSISIQSEEKQLDETANLIVSLGEDASIETGDKESGIINLYFKFDEAGEYFDIDYQLKSNGNQSISKLEGNPLSSSLTISASIDNITKLVKIETEKFNNKTLALASQTITREELAKEVSYCYAARKYISPKRWKVSDTYEYHKFPSKLRNPNKHIKYRITELQAYIGLIDYLIGSENTYKYINQANLRQEDRNATIQAKRYCSKIDEKLTLIKD